MESIIKVLVAFLIAAALGFLMAIPIMLLWNEIMPDIFGLVEIDYWEALFVYLLSTILFKANNN